MAVSEAGIKLVAEGVEAYESNVNRANNATQKFANDTQSSTGKFEGWSSVVRGAFEKVGGLVTEQLANAGQALIGFGVDSVKLAGEFEGNMNQFAAAASIPESEIKDFEKLFVDLGKELPVSTMETVQAATALVKGGIDPTVVAAGGLRDTLNFAAAAGLGLEQSADIVAKQLGQFVPVTASAAEKTNFMATSMDLMTKVANSSTVDVADLAAGMAQAGGVANAIGLDYEDFAVTMGAISPAFSSAQEAGTSLKNFLTRLQPASTPAFDAMRDLGLVTGDTEAMMKFLKDNGVAPLSTEMGSLDQQVREFLKTEKGLSASQIEKTMAGMTQNAFFANGELLSMQEIVGTLETATKDLTDEQKIQYMQTIFGADAMNTVVTLAGMGVEGFDAFADSVSKANGVTEQAEAVNKGFDFQMNNLQGSLEAFQLTIGGPMRDAVAPYIGMLNQAVGVMMNVANALMGDKEAFAALPGPIQEVINYFNTLGSTTDTLMMIYGELMYQLQPVIDMITSAFTDVGGMLVEFFTGESFNMILSSVMNLVFAVIDIVSHMATVIQPIITRATEIIGIMLESLGPIAQAIVDTFASPVVVSAINSIVDLLGAVVSLGIELVLLAWNDLVEDFNNLWPTIDWVIKSIGSVISTVLPFVTEIIKGLVNYIRGDTTNAFSGLSALASETWNGIVISIKTAIISAMIQVTTFIVDIKDQFDGMVTAALGFGKDIVQGLINGINAKIADVIAAAGNLVDEIKKKLNVGFLFGSPSKVTTEMGEWIGEGMSIGMDKSTRDVLESSQDLVMAARAPMMAAAGGGGTTNITNNYSLGVSTTASPTVIVRSYNLMRGSV
jgi:phage-related protein